MTTRELWKLLEQSFIRSRNINFNRYFLIPRKEKKVESVEQYNIMKELAKNCNIENFEETVKRNVFITIMPNT